jgi:phage terminase small subunit
VRPRVDVSKVGPISSIRSGLLLASRARLAYYSAMSSRSALNPRQTAFVRHLAEGKSQAQAYLDAGYRGDRRQADANAARLIANDKVALHLGKLQAAAQERTEVTVDSLVEELEQMRLWAIECRHPAAGVSAIMGKAKLLGLVIDKTEISGSIRKPSRTPTSDRHVNRGVEAPLCAEAGRARLRGRWLALLVISH